MEGRITYLVSKDTLSEVLFYFKELLLYDTVSGLLRLKISRLLVQILPECIFPWLFCIVWWVP